MATIAYFGICMVRLARLLPVYLILSWSCNVTINHLFPVLLTTTIYPGAPLFTSLTFSCKFDLSNRHIEMKGLILHIFSTSCVSMCPRKIKVKCRSPIPRAEWVQVADCLSLCFMLHYRDMNSHLYFDSVSPDARRCIAMCFQMHCTFERLYSIDCNAKCQKRLDEAELMEMVRRISEDEGKYLYFTSKVVGFWDVGSSFLAILCSCWHLLMDTMFLFIRI